LDGIREALFRWMSGVLHQRGWSAAAWAREAGVTPTNLTRFLKDPDTASLPSAETIGRLARAAGSEPRFLSPAGPGSGRPNGGGPDGTGANGAAKRVPVLSSAQFRRVMEMPDGEAVSHLARLLRDGAPSLPFDHGVTERACALKVTTLHMNAGGMLPDDYVVVEPPDRLPVEMGDLVVVLDGDGVCGYRYYPPLLVPVSTDSGCSTPLRLDQAAIAGVAVQLVRPLRP